MLKGIPHRCQFFVDKQCSAEYGLWFPTAFPSSWGWLWDEGGWEALPIHPHIDLRCPDSLVDYVEEFSYVCSSNASSLHTSLLTQVYWHLLSNQDISGIFMYFAILKYISAFHRLWMRRQTLRRKWGLKPEVGKPVRVWAPFPPGSCLTQWKCRLCWWAPAQVQEWSSKKSHGLLTQPAVSTFPSETLHFPAGAGSWVLIDSPVP